MSKETDGIRLGLAKYHAAEYDRDGHDFWRAAEKTVLEASVKEYVRGILQKTPLTKKSTSSPC